MYKMPKKIIKKVPANIIFLYTVLALSVITNIIFFYKFVSNNNIDINVLETYELSEELIAYREPNIINTNIPNKSPFGGTGLDNTYITAGYMDAEYTQTFGTPHYAIDIIPTDNYYKSLPFFLSKKRALVFATHNGTAQYLVDEFGANYLVITNPENNLRTMYVHLEASYVVTNDIIEAGQIIGVMGNTGKSTGSHLHYAIQIKNARGSWQNINPLNYIY